MLTYDNFTIAKLIQATRGRVDPEDVKSILKECIKMSNSDREIINFIIECRANDHELDADDLEHVLKLDFDYVRKQWVIIN